MIKVVIDRKRWNRGNGDTGSKLLMGPDSDQPGQMCCLGFAALACGYTPDDIEGASTPKFVEDRQKWPKGTFTDESPWYRVDTTEVISDMMRLNDRQLGAGINIYSEKALLELSSEKVREEKLAELALTIGMEFEYVDGE